MNKISRRSLLAGGIVAAGAVLNAAGRRFGLVPPDSGGFYGPGETLSYAAHRVFGRHAMAREFPRSMISAMPFANAIAPPTEAFKGHQSSNFATWRLTVDGFVSQPRALSLADLRAMEVRSQVTEVVCEEGWSYIAEWTGTPLSAVLNAIGVRQEARYLVYYSSDPDWWESIDIDEAMHSQTLLTWAMNGADLPVPFGGPLRLRVPRQLGYKSVKFLDRLVLTDTLEGFGDGSGQSEVNAGYAWYAGDLSGRGQRMHAKRCGALAIGLVLSAMACRESPPAVAPEGFVEVPGGRVFYKTMGGGDKTPLLLLHGGPGGRSCGFSVLSELATDRRVIRYDQLGSGQSERPADLNLWRTDRFVDELDALRTALGLREVHILGHSWGGTLATEYLLTKGQEGVKSVILSSPLISTPRWVADARRLRSTLPESVQSVLNKCEAVETADDPSCQAANDVFEEHFVRGAKALPAVPECDGITGGDQVYRHMWGAAEFTATGVLRDYDRTDRLAELKLPVLFLAGRHDEAVPETVADFQRRVPGAKMMVLEHSAHSTYRTETAEYVKIVRQFMDEAERRR